MEYLIATVLMVLIGWIIMRVRQAAFASGEESGCVRGIAMGERNIIAEVRRDELMVQRFQRIPQVPYGYSLVETQELRKLQALREQFLALPASTESSSMQLPARRAALMMGGRA